MPPNPNMTQRPALVWRVLVRTVVPAGIPMIATPQHRKPVVVPVLEIACVQPINALDVVQPVTCVMQMSRLTTGSVMDVIRLTRPVGVARRGIYAERLVRLVPQWHQPLGLVYLAVIV